MKRRFFFARLVLLAGTALLPAAEWFAKVCRWIRSRRTFGVDSPCRQEGHPPPAGSPPGTPRKVSPEGVAYLERLRKNTPFGTTAFDMQGLRAGMGSRRAPTTPEVRFIKVKIGEIPAEWVVAPGADPDVRLLYIHGGGFVSGSGAFYLTMAAHISAAAKCAVLLTDYRLAPEHPFPAGLDDCVALTSGCSRMARPSHEHRPASHSSPEIPQAGI